MTTDEEATRFRQAVVAAPDDDGPRLVFADWLVEQGDPYGEFVHVQCRLARCTRSDVVRASLLAREERMWAEYGGEWARSLSHIAMNWRYERGFVEYVGMSAENFLEHGDRLFAREPVTSLALHGNVWEVASHAPLERVRQLDISKRYGCHLTGYQIFRVAESPRLANLRSLDVRGHIMRARWLKVLLDLPNLANLRELVVDRWMYGEKLLTRLDERFGAPMADDDSIVDVQPVLGDVRVDRPRHEEPGASPGPGPLPDFG